MINVKYLGVVVILICGACAKQKSKSTNVRQPPTKPIQDEESQIPSYQLSASTISALEAGTVQTTLSTADRQSLVAEYETNMKMKGPQSMVKSLCFTPSPTSKYYEFRDVNGLIFGMLISPTKFAIIKAEQIPQEYLPKSCGTLKLVTKSNPKLTQKPSLRQLRKKNKMAQEALKDNTQAQGLIEAKEKASSAIWNETTIDFAGLPSRINNYREAYFNLKNDPKYKEAKAARKALSSAKFKVRVKASLVITKAGLIIMAATQLVIIIDSEIIDLDIIDFNKQ
jgi:hypothetical protein